MDLGVKYLKDVDPEIYQLCKDEEFRQRSCIELIASENFASEAVLATLSSTFQNKYSEGVVGARYCIYYCHLTK